MPSFNDIVGQEQIKEHLSRAIRTGRVSHAYIIEGEQYAGKEFIARAFAQTLLCERIKERPDLTPCGVCHSCKQAVSGNHPDVIFIRHAKPNTISVEEVRSLLCDDVAIAPYSSEKKIYIMNEAEKMTVQAQNALLKTLEEPPAYAVIMLLTTNLRSLLDTMTSRAVALSMRPVSDESVREYLKKEVQAPDYRIDTCVAFARGNVGRARMLATSEEFDNIKTDALDLVKNIGHMDVYELMQHVARVSEYKVSVGDYLDILSIWYRDALLFKATNDANQLIFKNEALHVRRVAEKCAYEGIENILNALTQAKNRLSANVNFELTMELLFMAIRENS